MQTMKVIPSLPKGTRDFGPDELRKRNYIFGVIRNVFEKYGFQPLETPAMENLSTLEGKMGNEGDKLLFRILNSGDYLKDVRSKNIDISEKNLKSFTSLVAEKGLRYDLTIPLARYVVQHQHEITFPFKRYQIQPVWRADRPQKGRYREFYQCDADVVGSDSLLNEVELILTYAEVFDKLKLNVRICFNNRKLLTGFAEKNMVADRLTSFTVALDKLDKIGESGVNQELEKQNIPTEILNEILQSRKKSGVALISFLEKYMSGSDAGTKGVQEIKEMLTLLDKVPFPYNKPELDLTLARGLDYYTGTIMEVKSKDAEIGGLGGGGRYDNLTGVFGLPGVSGVGISFGVERIYDVMEKLKLFDKIDLQSNTTRVLFINFGGEAETKAFQYLQQLRSHSIPAEIYPSSDKMKKQIGYADKKGIPYAIFVGEDELKKEGTMQMKDLKSGEQKTYKIDEVIELLSRK